MSVVSSHIHWTGRNGSSDEKFQRSYSAQWRVTTDNKNDGPQIVYAQANGASPDPVPAKYQAYSVGNDSDPNAYHLTSSIAPFNEGSQFEWLVTVEFGPPPSGEAPGERNENPLLRPVRYSVDWAAFTKPLTEDINGDPVANAAKQLFDPPPEQEDLRPVLVAKKNVATLGEVISLMITYKNAVNADTFYGAAAREAKIESITAGDQQHENGYSYYEVTIRVMFNESGEKFDKSFVNQGFKHFVSNADKTLVVAKDAKGVPMNEPVLLAADGTRLADNTPGNTLEFRTFPEVAFSGLGI